MRGCTFANQALAIVAAIEDIVFFSYIYYSYFAYMFSIRKNTNSTQNTCGFIYIYVILKIYMQNYSVDFIDKFIGILTTYTRLVLTQTPALYTLVMQRRKPIYASSELVLYAAIFYTMLLVCIKTNRQLFIYL